MIGRVDVDVEKKKADHQIALITDPKKDQKQIAAPKEKPVDISSLQAKYGPAKGPAPKGGNRLTEEKQNNRWRQLAGIQ